MAGVDRLRDHRTGPIWTARDRGDLDTPQCASASFLAIGDYIERSSYITSLVSKLQNLRAGEFYASDRSGQQTGRSLLFGVSGAGEHLLLCLGLVPYNCVT